MAITAPRVRAWPSGLSASISVGGGRSGAGRGRSRSRRREGGPRAATAPVSARPGPGAGRVGRARGATWRWARPGSGCRGCTTSTCWSPRSTCWSPGSALSSVSFCRPGLASVCAARGAAVPLRGLLRGCPEAAGGCVGPAGCAARAVRCRAGETVPGRRLGPGRAEGGGAAAGRSGGEGGGRRAGPGSGAGPGRGGGRLV